MSLSKLKMVMLVVGLLMVIENNAKASVVYTYTGYDFSNTPPSQYHGVYGDVDSVTGTMELSNALPANANDLYVIPVSFSFSDGIQKITSATPLNPLNDTDSFQFYTNASGAITAWQVLVYSSTYGAWVGTGCGNAFNCADGGRLDGNNGAVSYNMPGIWQATTVSSTPLPAALPLFASALGGIGLLSWRRKRRVKAVAA
jgi:hypothetical protein